MTESIEDFIKRIESGDSIPITIYNALSEKIPTRTLAEALEKRYKLTKRDRTLIESINTYLKAEAYEEAFRMTETYPIFGRMRNTVAEQYRRSNSGKEERARLGIKEHDFVAPITFMQVLEQGLQEAYRDGNWKIYDNVQDMIDRIQKEAI